jgi:MutS domain V
LADPQVEYAGRLKDRLQTLAVHERAHIRLGNEKLVTVLAGLVVGWLSAGRHMFSSYWIFVPVGVFLVLWVVHERRLRARSLAERGVSFYRQRIARLEDNWAGTGSTGERFHDPAHVYADDLDIFGRGSLFELLSAARTPMGEERLAAWLKAGAPVDVVQERQQMIAELREKLDLREDLALAGEELRPRLNPQALIQWAEGGPTLPSALLWRGMALLLALGAVAGLVFGIRTGNYFPLLIVVVAETLVHRWLKQRVLTVMSSMDSNAEGLDLFGKVVKRIEAESFASPRMAGLVGDLKKDGRPASAAIRRLARIAYWIEAHDSFLIRLVDIPLLYSVQIAYTAEAWRRSRGSRVRSWVDAVGEMEALASLAAYAYEHPRDGFPTFVPEDAAPLFDGEQIGHPLIPEARCVPNDIRLDRDHRVMMVSGSNMSGKSTLLRTVGVNAVLAMAGAPVRGKSLRLSPLAVGSRLRSTDSLQENRSSFYTEILRIRQVFDCADGKKMPVLFLFDELLEGTNSKDRRVGAESLLRALVAHGAIGIVTTHDLALTEITAGLGSAVTNAHLQDYVEDGRMRFDYKLRPGVVARSNALELMRLVGLQV